MALDAVGFVLAVGAEPIAMLAVALDAVALVLGRRAPVLAVLAAVEAEPLAPSLPCSPPRPMWARRRSRWPAPAPPRA